MSIGAKIVLEGEKEYRKAISDINREQRVLSSEMRKVSAEFDGNANSVDALTKKNGVLVKDYDKQEERIKTLRGALENASEVYGENSKQVQNWQIQLNNAEAKLSTLDKELQENEKHLDEAKESTDGTAESIDEYGKEVKEAEKDTSRFGDVLKASLASQVIINGVKALGNSVKSLTKGALGVGMEFESSMSLVAATMGITTDEIDAGSNAFIALSGAAKEAGAKTKYNSAEGAEALNYLALAGYSVEKSVAALPVVLDLASSGGLELAYASDLITDSMSALGMETDELNGFVDQLAKTSQKSNTNIAQLGEGILTVGGTAKIMAGGTTELNTQLGILADNGIKGSEGGTALRNVLLALSAPTKKQADQMKALGVNTYDANGQLRPTNEIFNDINGILSTMTQQGQTEVLNNLFNKVDLKAANALLANSGDRFNNLSNEIANADGAAGEMAKTMEHNLKGQIEEFDSAAEAVGITVYEKFEIPLRDAVRAGTLGLSDLNRELDSGGLGGSVDSMAEKFGDLSEKAISLGLDALPHVVNGLGWLIDNGPIIIGTISGLVAGVTAFKTGSAILKGIETVNGLWKAYKVATDGATISQAALNAVQMASPVGLIAGAIGLAVGGLVAYKLSTSDAKDETGLLTKEINKNIEANKGFNEEVKNSALNRQSKVKDIEAEHMATKKLSDELYLLADKTNKSNAENRRMQSLVDELNNLIPELNLNIHEETGLLSIQERELNNLIDANKEYAKAKAAQEDLIAITEDQYKAEKNLWVAEQDRISVQKELKQKEDDYARALEESNDIRFQTTEEMERWSKQMDILPGQIAALREEEEELNIVAADNEKIVKELGKEYEYTSEYIDKFGDANSEASKEVQKASKEASEALDKMQEEYEETLKATSDKIYESMGLFDEFSKNTELSGSQLLKNLQSQVDGMRDWADNMQSLSKRGIEEGLLHELYEMGPKAAGEIKALNDMTDKELQTYNDTWKEKTKLASDIALNQTEDMREGMEEEIGKLPGSAGKVGKDTGTSLANGINVNKYLVKEEILNTINESIGVGKERAKSSKSIGEAIGDGIVSGLKGKGTSINYESERAAQLAIRAFNKKLDINSPSGVFEESGEFSAEGWELGFNKKMARISREMEVPIPEGMGTNGINLGGLSAQNNATSNIIELLRDFANRPAVFNLNGREFAYATVDDFNRVLGAKL